MSELNVSDASDEINRLKAELAYALRVVEAARVYIQSSTGVYIVHPASPYHALAVAVREWEQAQGKEKEKP